MSALHTDCKSIVKAVVVMVKKLRIIYAALFFAVLLTEIFIALFVKDNFVRPYVGDVLVTILLCCLCRTAVPKGAPALPVYVFIFAAVVEVAQYFDVVKLLGMENSVFLSTLIGRSFSFVDLICYGIGCLVFWAAEKAVYSVWKRRAGSP